MTGTAIPIINVILALIALAVALRIYILIREGALGRAWLVFIAGFVSFGVMQIAATLMRTDDNMPIGDDISALGVVHDVAALFIIVSFLTGSYMQYRTLTSVSAIPFSSDEGQT